MIEKTIAPEDGGKKLHRYMRQTLPGMPLSGVYKLIRTGRVKINGKRGKMDAALSAGDTIEIWMREDDYASVSRPVRKFSGVSTDIDVVHEDDDLLVVNKPSGLLVHPDREEKKDTLIGRVLAYLYERGEIADGRAFLPAVVNRLDRNTSGLVLIGKNADTLRKLAAAFRDRKIRKWYLAIVEGEVPASGFIDTPLEREEKEGVVRSRTLFHRQTERVGKNALTRFVSLSSSAVGRHSLLAVEIASGRTHQIRAHMQSIGHPLLGDVKYGGHPAFGVNYHLLHAACLRMPEGREFQAPPPPAFMRALSQAGLVLPTGWLEAATRAVACSSDADDIPHDHARECESRDRRNK